ncbi:MAG: DnaJ domain-containing protein [Micavibrio aeruginosavorus]|nr:DnaJ domain-containing protein [Micavibrio aeruginosavorus]
MPGCNAAAEHRAPKDRGLKEYYRFCLAHVQEYNKAWNFFAGMAQHDIEHHIRASFLWDRPTRRFDAGNMQEELYRKAWQTRNFSDDDPPDTERGQGFRFSNDPRIKTRYKELVKKYHPDLNPGDRKAEEMIKSINMSYTILKLAYEKYDSEYRD